MGPTNSGKMICNINPSEGDFACHRGKWILLGMARRCTKGEEEEEPVVLPFGWKISAPGAPTASLATKTCRWARLPTFRHIRRHSGARKVGWCLPFSGRRGEKRCHDRSAGWGGGYWEGGKFQLIKKLNNRNLLTFFLSFSLFPSVRFFETVSFSWFRLLFLLGKV